MIDSMFTVRLERIRTLRESTKDFRFVCADNSSLDYKPGQFYRFVFTDEHGEFERSYSLCNFEELYGQHMELVISQVEKGRATNLLFNCEEGLEAKVTGPFGRLTLPSDPPGRLFMVATSVGLAPYMPNLKELETRGFPKVVLLLGVRDRSEFIYGEVLKKYAEQHDCFELRLCRSREKAVAGYEYDGYVNAQIEHLDVEPDSDHFLLCGNPVMIDEAWGYLKDVRFKSKNVVREKYVFARESTSSTKVPTEEHKQLVADKVKKYGK
jgi:ferredoxin-NADP reductase